VELAINPALVDAIVAAVVLEFAALALLLVHGRAAHLVVPLFLYLASGAFLLLALRASLAAAAPVWIAGALLASLGAHLLSLRQGYRALIRLRPTPLRGSV
jgi:hypothetical protein